jgi:hypothetical protein
MRRQKMADRATRYMPAGVKECARETILLTYTDKQLRTADRKEYIRRGLIEVLIDRWDNNDVDFSIEEEDEFQDFHYRFSNLIQAYCDDCESSVYLVRIRSIAAAFERVKAKYGDPSRDGYQGAIDSLAEIAFRIQQEIKCTSRNLNTAQEEGLVAAMFLLRQSGGDEFLPALSPEDASTHRWLTARILDSPDDVENHLAAFHDRMSRLREVFLALTVTNASMQDYDALCDYPDELIDRLAEFMFSDFNRWEDFCRYVLTDNERNNQQAVSEVLCFMEPFEDFNMRYLSWAIPTILRAYTCLPPMEDYSKAPKALREQCEALLLVSITMGNTSFLGEPQASLLNNDKTIRDQRLVGLLMTHPERARTIARAIREREVADFESLNQISSGVLWNGAL